MWHELPATLAYWCLLSVAFGDVSVQKFFGTESGVCCSLEAEVNERGVGALRSGISVHRAHPGSSSLCAFSFFLSFL